MKMRIASAGTPVSVLDLTKGLWGRGNPGSLETDLRRLFGVHWCGLSGSGTSAFFAILCALKKRTDCKEVLLSAYE